LWLTTGAHALAISEPEKVVAQNTSCENTATPRSCSEEDDINTDYYNFIPDTGVIRDLSFLIVFHSLFTCELEANWFFSTGWLLGILLLR